MPALLSLFGLMLCILALTGAGGRDSSGAQSRNLDNLNATGMPIVKEKITLQLTMPKGVGQGNADRIWFWKWAEKEMNIHFDVVQIDGTVWNERRNLMLASNELPDLFFNGGFSTTDIFQYGQKEGQFIPLNALIDTYAPALTQFFRQYPSTRAQSTCPDGNIYFFPGLNQQPQTYNCPRPWIHTGWLSAVGMNMPANLDEFYNVLVAFRDRDPNGNGLRDEIPFTGGPNAMGNSVAIITAAMGYPEPNPLTPVVVNNEAKIFATSPVYGEYLRYMNRLFSEGLMDNEWYTNTATMLRAKGSEDRVGIHTDSAPFTLAPDEKIWSLFEALTPMTSQWNNTRMWLNDPEVIVGGFTITRACRYPEAAARFADYFYTEQGAIYSYYGPAKDHPDLMGDHDGWFFDPTGAVTYDRPAEFPSDQDYRMGAIAAKSPPSFGNNDFQTAIENVTGLNFIFAPTARHWRVSMDKYVKEYQIPRYPVVYFDGDANDRVLELTTTISDYITMMDARFITGVEPLNNIPAYLERLKTMGVTDLEKYYKDAYAVYRRNL